MAESDGSRLEELLELHRLAHVALHLQLPGHVRGGRVLLAVRDFPERLGSGRDRAVGVAVALGDRHLAVVDVHDPCARAVDVELVARRHPLRLRLVDAGRERLEELPRLHEARDYRTGSGSRRVCARLDGSINASASPTSGAAAAAYIAARRSTESASAPRPTAAIPPRPIERPIDSPDAMPIRCGRYSCAITIVTPNVEITQMPTNASAIAPGTPPTST